jgi:hypothetical protein
MVFFDEDTKKTIITWLGQQGISTILLCCILGFIGYGIVVLVPTHLTMIQDGYEKNAATLSRSLEKIADSHDKDREMFMRMITDRNFRPGAIGP